MMDNLKEHIKENRLRFDEHKADKAKLWAQIERQLDKPKTVKLWKHSVFKVAASIVIALGIISVINTISNTNGSTKNSLANQELNDINAYYKGLVAYQVNLLNESPNLSIKQKKDFLSFMNELDAEYDDLRLELESNLDNEQILNAIVTNYKKRIELIENLLKQINSSKNIKESNDAYIL